ncbi:hypothetical protein EVAR_3874_1 [Eumeta japonica]|uniref:Uncharacterized protein n=1 Tax=Eumeta variegata TaxID=151549 RepID=A0A4C1SRF6_EUMVA|nr:hypothetical protein EVAR_3874_1 [Eumeta japonica]
MLLTHIGTINASQGLTFKSVEVRATIDECARNTKGILMRRDHSYLLRYIHTGDAYMRHKTFQHKNPTATMRSLSAESIQEDRTSAPIELPQITLLPGIEPELRLRVGEKRPLVKCCSGRLP